MRIAAVDPGGTTGLAVLETPCTLLRLLQDRRFDRIIDEVLSAHPDELVVEKFVVYPEARFLGWQRTPSELIGRLKAVAEQHGIRVVEQAPSQKHGARKLLKPLGLYRPGMDHAMDALAHAVYRSLYGHGFEMDDHVQRLLRKYLQRGEE